MAYVPSTYNEAKEKLTELLSNGSQFIVLYGSGKNGKSHLMNEFSNRAILDHEFDFKTFKPSSLHKKNNPHIVATNQLPHADFCFGKIINMNNIVF